MHQNEDLTKLSFVVTNSFFFSVTLSSTEKTTSRLSNPPQGIPAFWKGAVPTAGGMILENCMAFGVNEALKRAFPDNPKEDKNASGPPSLIKPFLMGSITGCFSATVLLPSEIIKAKTQIVVGRHVSSQQILREMLQKQGIRSLFIGFDAQLMRDGPFYAFFFGSYEVCCYTFRTFIPSMPDELNYFLRYVHYFCLCFNFTLFLQGTNTFLIYIFKNCLDDNTNYTTVVDLLV